MIGKETVKYSLRNLNKRKTRSIFTIISILIGIATIFIFLSFGLGLYKYIGDLTTGSSADKIVIQPTGGPLKMLSSNVKFYDKDIKAVEKVPGVYEVSGSSFKTIEVKSRDKRIYTLLISYEPKKPLVMDGLNIGIFKGKQLSENKKEIILGYNYMVDKKIFPKGIKLNQNIELNNEKIKVIGFMNKVGNPQDDSNVYISNNYIKKLFPEENLSYIWIIAKVDINKVENIIGKIEKSLREERNLKKGREDFFVQSYQDVIKGYSNALNIVIGFIILIALISIFVSTINTATTMITSVLERTKEIGIVKSIGARNSDIFWIFLFESGFLGFIAGVIGVLVGFAFSYTGGIILNNLNYGFLQPNFNIWLFIGGIIFATITGAISGVFPAIRASRINPVDALRYE